jgi:hypothetical protein
VFQKLNDQNIIDHIYYYCLFELQCTNEESKMLQCCSSESRKSAYKVLEII